MKFAWDAIFGTLVDILKPKRLVEVGAFYGHGTRRILEYCREADAVLQTLDPLSPDPAEARGQQEVFEGLLREFPGRLTFHRECSLPLLDRIGPYDAILIDGDHNWYTVIEELRSVERMARTHGIVPLIVLDDIGWPHGRRDCYYVPDRIPGAFRHPHRRAGVAPGQSALVDPGGYFQNFQHAEHEGGPRNGVRTAVEDFLKETSLDLVCRQIPLRSGTAVLVPRDDTPTGASVRLWLDAWSFPESQVDALWQLSADYIALNNVSDPLIKEVNELHRVLARARAAGFA